MVTRVGVLIVAGCFIGLLGCVSADVYRVKEREVQSLYRANEDMQEQNETLMAEKTGLEIRSAEMKKQNEGLKDRIEEQSEEIAYLKNRAEKLEIDGEGLRDRVEKLIARIADLDKENQRLAALSRPENLLRSLAERLGDLQQQVEALSGENEKLKTERVIARTEEKLTGVAEDERTIESAEGMPQPVQVSAGQQVEESTTDWQPQEERKPLALSVVPEEHSDKP